MGIDEKLRNEEIRTWRIHRFKNWLYRCLPRTASTGLEING